jgi:hypothetical protein
MRLVDIGWFRGTGAAAMRSFLERGIHFDHAVAFNDVIALAVIALGAIARGAARSAARTRAAGPARQQLR